MNNNDAMRDGLPWRSRLKLSAGECDLAFVWPMNSTQDFHQGRLSSTIFTNQCMDFATADREIDVAQYEIPLKRLADISGR